MWNRLDGWDWALLVIAAYVAVAGLVRLMIARRDEYQARLKLERLRQPPAAQLNSVERRKEAA